MTSSTNIREQNVLHNKGGCHAAAANNNGNADDYVSCAHVMLEVWRNQCEAITSAEIDNNSHKGTPFMPILN
eukprot:2831884-Ditylum_brightwellii.AAC.1